MGLLDKVDHFKGVPSAEQGDGEFVKGMRSGGYGALASLNNLAGGATQNAAPEFSQGRLRAADEYAEQAQATAPRVTSMRQAWDGNLQDKVDYAAGLAGGMVPVGVPAIAAGLMTGGAGAAMLAGTGVMAPVRDRKSVV